MKRPKTSHAWPKRGNSIRVYGIHNSYKLIHLVDWTPFGEDGMTICGRLLLNPRYYNRKHHDKVVPETPNCLWCLARKMF